MGIWVDTDLGFDDLWALLMLRRYGVTVDGVSLTAGNTPMERVLRNAAGAVMAFDLPWPLFQGASAPLARPQITAEPVLTNRGMRTRGHHLPDAGMPDVVPAGDGIVPWLTSGSAAKTVLALGPLTTIAHLARHHPDAYRRIDHLVWMGGASARGNQTPFAEFNAHADAHAFARVAASGVRFSIVDLAACRQATFGESDIPADLAPLVRDLLGGYLDIALTRGRAHMAIYDPLAALAITHPDCLTFSPRGVTIVTDVGEAHGQTLFGPADDASTVMLATGVCAGAVAHCLDGLRKSTP